MEMLIVIAVVALAIVLAIIIALIVYTRKSADRDDNRTFNNYDDADRNKIKEIHFYKGGTQVTAIKNTSYLSREERAGLDGELTVGYYLSDLIDEGEYLLNNLLLPLKNGHKTEIDSVLITRRGIFCIEIKNWVGNIRGEDDEDWIQEYDDPFMPNKKHRNPVKQNEGHCRTLERILNYKFKIENIVIFANPECSNDDSLYSYTIDEFERYYSDIENDYLSYEIIKLIYQKLRLYVATDLELEEHGYDVRSSHPFN